MPEHLASMFGHDWMAVKKRKFADSIYGHKNRLREAAKWPMTVMYQERFFSGFRSVSLRLIEIHYVLAYIGDHFETC